MKKIILWGAVIVAVLVIAVVAVVFLKLDTIVKSGVERVGPQLTKTEVRLSGVHISPFSGNGHLSGLFIGNPEGYHTPFAIKVGKLDVAVDIASVRGDVVTIKSLVIKAPEITYEGGVRGPNNINKILENIEAATGSTTTAKPGSASTSSNKKFVVQDVVIEDAKVHVSINGLSTNGLTVPLPPVHLQNLGNAGQGLAVGELAQQIIKPLLNSIVDVIGKQAVSLGKEAVSDVLKGSTKEAGQALDKAGSAIKGLFK